MYFRIGLGVDLNIISVIGVFAMLSVVVFFLLINKIFNTQPLKFPVNENLELEQYAFGFEETQVNVQKRSLLIRIIVYLMAVLLVFTPLNTLLNIGI
ncbi:hypothetical protein [Psychroserpens burtonensis]|uniref:hypothetical protein n=1 Tax=Psychroserpens burtonensis TaxID=49278 RepID=UPI00048AD95D|nr:hypothetical protein [Psychroserpens burtonensis]